MADLEKPLINVLELIDLQLEKLDQEWQSLPTRPAGGDFTRLQNSNGDYVVIPLLVAKANALQALVQFRDMRARQNAERSRFFGPILPAANHD